MNSNKIWRGWATNFGNGDGMIPFFSHSPALPESYEIVLLPVADFDALCAEVARQDNIIAHLSEYWNGNENERAMADMCWHVISECDKAKADRPVRVAEILKRWKEQQT